MQTSLATTLELVKVGVRIMNPKILIVLLLLWLRLPAWAQCPVFVPGVSVGTLQSRKINEASGMAASRKNPHVLWVHNDSGDSPRVFAIHTDGTLLGTYSLSGADATDWEDMAIGPGPVEGVDYLYLGDIGDNDEDRSDIKVYRVAEPVVDANQAPVTTTLTGVETIVLQYPDGARDAETLMIDPPTRDLYIISKREIPSRVYRAAYPQSTTSTTVMEYKISLPWGLAAGGDISPDGSEVIVRGVVNNDDIAALWQKSGGTELWQAFANTPCNVALLSEPNGEAICFVKGFACGYFTVSEKKNQPIYFFQRLLETDLNGDCVVDITDLSILINFWLESNCPLVNDCDGADLFPSGMIDFFDFSVLEQDWFFGT